MRLSYFLQEILEQEKNESKAKLLISDFLTSLLWLWIKFYFKIKESIIHINLSNSASDVSYDPHQFTISPWIFAIMQGKFYRNYENDAEIFEEKSKFSKGRWIFLGIIYVNAQILHLWILQHKWRYGFDFKNLLRVPSLNLLHQVT